jgi:transporter family-2 protein
LSFNSYIAFLLLAFVAGMAVPTQASLNSRLAGVVQSPIAAAFVAMGLGTCALFTVLLVSGYSFSNLVSTDGGSKSIWIGGLCGAMFVASMAVTVPRIGVMLSLALTVAGQMALSLAIDHFGWFGMPQTDISAARLVGAVLITAGVVLIQKF